MGEKTKQYNVDGSKIIAMLPSLLEKHGYRINEISSSSITVDTSSSIWSWGEKIIISINNSRSGCKVTVNSETKYQLTDWGKSDENIDKVFAIIDSGVGE